MKILAAALMLFSSSVANADELKLDATYSIHFKKTQSFSPKIIHAPANQFRPSIIAVYHKEDGSEDFYGEIQLNKIDESITEKEIEHVMRGYVESKCTGMLHTAIEDEILVKDLPGETAGQYCTLTDKAVSVEDAKGPNNYRFITLSAASQADVIYTSIAFSNSAGGRFLMDFLELLSSIKIIDTSKSMQSEENSSPPPM